MKKFTLSLNMSLSLMVCMVCMAFSLRLDVDSQAAFLNKILNKHHDGSSSADRIKRYELNITNTGFCRYKRFLVNGKVEYFSFNLIKFKDIDFYGTEQKGKLYMRTTGDDVIVQTYNDKKFGDIDSMASYMYIPLKDIKVQDLVDISDRMIKVHAQLLAQK